MRLTELTHPRIVLADDESTVDENAGIRLIPGGAGVPASIGYCLSPPARSCPSRNLDSHPNRTGYRPIRRIPDNRPSRDLDSHPSRMGCHGGNNPGDPTSRHHPSDPRPTRHPPDALP